MTTRPDDEDDLDDALAESVKDLDLPEVNDDELLLVVDDADLIADDAPMAVDADTEATARCPHCGEELELTLDPAGGTVQEYVEDCFVCCRPYTVFVEYDDRGEVTVNLEPADGD